MAFLDDIGTYLAAASTPTQNLTLGTNLFLGRRPDTPDTIVALFETSGEAPTLTFGTNTGPPLEARGLQCQVRALGYATAESLATEVWSALCLIDNETLGTTRYLLADPVQSPFPLDRDAQDRMIHAFNFTVQREVA
jgi:hypothetical protein